MRNPSQAKENLKRKVLSQLDESLPIKEAMPNDLKTAFEQFLQRDDGLSFVKDPYIEVAQEYARAEFTLKDLSENRGGHLLHPEVAKAFAKYLLEDDNADYAQVRPYVHQYNALREVAGGRNLVVCTGTGSGKTECFLLPLIDCIYRQHIAAKEAGSDYVPHVRALILYPLNALVNDQVKRLRRLLRYLPEVTFGQYIGTTEKHVVKSTVPDDLLRDGQNLTAGAAWNQEAGGQSENALANELRTRAEWKQPADILVTNYSMLERLLLAPKSQSHFFDRCWNFIVVDEAHSYEGSTGTEIAWLMRRLSHRLELVRRPDEPALRFLATSATLSDGDDREQKAVEFVSRLFPAENFYPETGTFAPPVSEEFHGPALSTSIPVFCQDHKDLIQKTVEFEGDLGSWKKQRGDVDLKKNVIQQNGQIAANVLFHLQTSFDLLVPCRIPDDRHVDIAVTPTLRYLARLALCKRNPIPQSRRGRGGQQSRAMNLTDTPANWRHFLHDGSIHSPSAWPGDYYPQETHNLNPKGNRLDILGIWQKLRDGEALQSVHYYVFHYLYLAVGQLIRDEKLDLNENKFMLQVSDSTLRKWNDDVAQHEAEERRLNERREVLNREWGEQLNPVTGISDYGELLFYNLVQHPSVRHFMELTGAGEAPSAVTDLAQAMDMDPSQLEEFFTLTGLARLAPEKRRNPLIEVRYHQVIRDVADIGVYFENGNLHQPRFIRSTAEYREDQGHERLEKIFSLGLCRECGQPYLLGYSDTVLDRSETTDNPKTIWRSQTGQYKNLHAFAWFAPLPYDDAEEKYPLDADKRVWLNLSSGQVMLSETRPEGNHWERMHWIIPPSPQHGTSFISVCSRCGTTQNIKARYGIITPYEATGEQYKVMVLEAFATLSEEESDPTVRNNSMAHGRKVLAFSDSRPLAARLAAAFDTRQELRVMNYLVEALVREACERSVLPPEVQNDIQSLRAMANAHPNMRARYDALIQELETAPQVPNPSLEAISGVNALQQRLADLRYSQVFDWTDQEGNPVDRNTTSKFLVLRTLRDNSRQGLIAKGLVIPKSATIDSESNWTALRDEALGITDEVAKALCQKIYAYLVTKRKIAMPMEFCIPDDERHRSDDRTYLDRNPRTAITHTAFIGGTRRFDGAYVHKNSRIFDKILVPHVASWQRVEPDAISRRLLERITTWLERTLEQFTRRWRILGETSDGYQLEFGQVCKDLRIWSAGRAPAYEEIMPFSIEEHTAQIDGATGAAYQNAFAKGKINILSCSTTFEMGIDVGNLNNIFIANLPPASANYRQRAGRAGRRPGASAYVLSLAGRNSHDQHYFRNVQDLFWGKIDPPAIYLNKPVFAARHFRAEALHLFLSYAMQMQNNKSLEWDKISEFILGWKAQWNKDRNHWEASSSTTICENSLATWCAQARELVQEYIQGIRDYPLFLSGLAGDGQMRYSAVDDLRFQLTNTDGDLIATRDAYRFYQLMGGCRLPECDSDGNACESTSPKRLALRERLLQRLFQQVRRDFHQFSFNDVWPGNGQTPSPITMSQYKTLTKDTISVLSESCILPRYGFAIDTIELLPDENEGATVDLSRPLEIGLFEYAPGQVVIADKKKFVSGSAAFLHHPNDRTPCETLAEKLANHYRFCRQCRKMFPQQVGERCPECGELFMRRSDGSSLLFVTPEVFFARDRSHGRHEYIPYTPKGLPVVHWGGKRNNEIQVPGTSLITAESGDRMMQYINTNHGDLGFPPLVANPQNPGDGYFYVHEVQTNIAIWQLPPLMGLFPGEAQLPPIEYRASRVFLACQSAMFALRRAIARQLGVSTRDIGVLIPPAVAHQYSMVFYDTAAGGGGCALALTMQNANDSTTADRIRNIIEATIRMLREEDETCFLPDEELGMRQKPIPLAIYQTLEEPQKDSFRPATACYTCLKDYDNQPLHAVLDRWDALNVLEKLLPPPRLYEPYDGHEPQLYAWYRLRDGREFRRTPQTTPELLSQIAEQEKED